MKSSENNKEIHLESDANGSYKTKPADNIQSRRGSLDRDVFLNTVARLGASDLHLKNGMPPTVRIGGSLRTLNLDPLPDKMFEEKIFEFLTQEQKAQLLRNGSVDLAYDLNAVIRKGEEGMQRFTDGLQHLIEKEYIDRKTAYAAAPNPEELKMQLKGIHQTQGHILG